MENVVRFGMMRYVMGWGMSVCEERDLSVDDAANESKWRKWLGMADEEGDGIEGVNNEVDGDADADAGGWDEVEW